MDAEAVCSWMSPCELLSMTNGLALSRSAVGDAAGWQRLCSQLEAVRAATKVANARIVVVMVQEVAAGEVPEERAAVICRLTGIERK